MTLVLPVGLKNYLCTTKSKLPKGLSSGFYLSWEDGLWDIIASYQISKNSLILVPTFFCIDVIHNMAAHGLKVEYYPVDDNLQPLKVNLLKQIQDSQPSIVVLFHPVGITNQCVNDKFISQFPHSLIIIEDSVHRIVQPNKLHITRERYFCMTSLRKVVPLQGSFIYGTSQSISKLKGPDKSTFIYSYKVFILWIVMQWVVHLQTFFSQINFLEKSMGLLAEFMMKVGYDVIGDSKRSGYSFSYFKNKYDYIDHKRIRSIKRTQEKIYRENLKSLNKEIYLPSYRDTDRGELRGFPIVLKGEKRFEIIKELRKNGLLVRSELEGCPWAHDRSIIYLPLGPNLVTNHILHIVDLFQNCIQDN